jgi:hypothetical protein
MLAQGDASAVRRSDLVPLRGEAFLLIHSPLLGPSSWRPFGEVASRAGHPIAIPDLTSASIAQPPRWEALVEAAVAVGEDLGSEPVVIGHSGAGVFLPEIANRLRAIAMLFIDAVVPPLQGVHLTSPSLTRLLDDQVVDGRLRRWIEWWPAETVADLLPEPEARSRLSSDMPVVPRSFYDEAVPVPKGWSDLKCGYLRLSAAYDGEYAEAGRRGWARRQFDGDHLSIFTRSAPVLSALEDLIAAL